MILTGLLQNAERSSTPNCRFEVMTSYGTKTVTQVKSGIGRPVSHQKCLKGLGIRKLNQTVVVSSSPENMGMISKISYLLKVLD